jgi:Amt family ammonium transporter
LTSSDGTLLLCVLLITIFPLAHAGLALLNAGLGRSRSGAQAMLGSLCLVAIAAITWFVLGLCFEGLSGGRAHALIAGGKSWDWIATRPPFLHGLDWKATPGACAVVFQIFATGLAALIPWGTGADRWRFTAALASTVLLSGVVYPIFAHWVWAGGWLAALGLNFHLGLGFIDPGGAATLQALGGVAALVVAWIAGARRGKFATNGPPAAIPAHHIVSTLLGAALTTVGWLALNSLGALLFAQVPITRLLLVEVNTLLCASGAILASLLVTRMRFGKPDASLCANGWVAGLVASSAVAALVSPAAALVTGAVAGAFLPLAIEFLELRCAIDDPSGGITVHGISGIWGLLAAGLFTHGVGQFVAQMVGIATLLGLVLPVTYGLFALLNGFLPFRTDREGERLGMDLHELGAGAYPEFVLHSDEFIPR